MFESLHQYLSGHDMATLLHLSQRSLHCRTEAGLQQLIIDLTFLIDFENAICTQALLPDTYLDPDADMEILNISYPDEYVEIYKSQRLHLTDKVWCCALTQLSPVNWLKLQQRMGDSPSKMVANHFNMRDGWTLCTLDPGSGRCTLFSVSGPRPDPTIRTLKILEHFIPFFSLAYTRILTRKPPFPFKLTARETEVLNWLKDGKSSWEISQILKCSKRVVDFHAANIKSKLDSVSRAQCVAKAVAAGIIDM